MVKKQVEEVGTKLELVKLKMSSNQNQEIGSNCLDLVDIFFLWTLNLNLAVICILFYIIDVPLIWVYYGGWQTKDNKVVSDDIEIPDKLKSQRQILMEINYKLDGVGPVNNRPLTD